MRPGWRLLAIGGVFAGLLAVLILRMWYLQVTVPLDALQAAESQQIRVVSIAAPRGDHSRLQRHRSDGRDQGCAAALSWTDNSSPRTTRTRLVQNLAALLDTPAVVIRGRFEAAGSGARFPIGDEISQSVGVFVLEHIEDFPGVSIEALPVRLYPLGESAAHIVGYIGAPQESDLERPDVSPRDQVGKFGVERTYDRLLRGTPGRITYQVNAKGEVLGVIEDIPPVPGGNLVTTIDIDTQRFVEDALVQGMRIARLDEEPVVRAAAVVLDPRDGSIIAMASVPSFDPGLFADGLITTAEWESLNEKAALNNFHHSGPLSARVGLQGRCVHARVAGFDISRDRHGVCNSTRELAGSLPRSPRRHRPDLLLRRWSAAVPQHAAAQGLVMRHLRRSGTAVQSRWARSGETSTRRFTVRRTSISGALRSRSGTAQASTGERTSCRSGPRRSDSEHGLASICRSNSLASSLIESGSSSISRTTRGWFGPRVAGRVVTS